MAFQFVVQTLSCSHCTLQEGLPGTYLLTLLAAPQRPVAQGRMIGLLVSWVLLASIRAGAVPLRAAACPLQGHRCGWAPLGTCPSDRAETAEVALGAAALSHPDPILNPSSLPSLEGTRPCPSSLSPSLPASLGKS